MGGLEVVLIVLAIGYGVEKAKEQWRHARDWHAANIARDHPDWHPRKVARHARWRNRTWWWNEAREGFPSFKAAWREDREHVRHIRQLRLLEHDNRISAWRDELRKLRAEHAKRMAPDGGPASPLRPSAAGPRPGSRAATGTGSHAGAGTGSGTSGGNRTGTIREPHMGTGDGNRTSGPREPAAGTGPGARPQQHPTHMLTVRNWGGGPQRRGHPDLRPAAPAGRDRTCPS